MTPKTPLPWQAEGEYVSGMTPNCRPNGEIIGRFSPSVHDAVPHEGCIKNAAYAVHAANSLPALQARVKELEAALKAMMELWRETNSDDDLCGCVGALPDCPWPPTCAWCLANAALEAKP